MTKREIMQAFLLFSLLIPLSWRWLYMKGEVPVNGNVLREAYPNWRLTHSYLLEMRSPLWDPYKDMGEPYLADPKSMAAYPLSWILVVVNSFKEFLKGWIFFHTLLAASFAWLLGFHWHRNAPAAWVSAVLFGLNGFFLAHGPYPNLFASAAWLPAILYFHVRKSLQPLAICLAMQWLAGYPPFTMLTFIALVFLTWAIEEGTWSCLASAGLLALALGAFQWIPFLEFLAHSSRGMFLDPKMALEFSIAPKDLIKELFWPQWIWMSPQIRGDPAVVSFYLGALATPLGLLAVWRGGQRERFLACAAIAALLLCMGAALPGYRSFIIFHVFRFPATWLLLAVTFVGLLAGAGVAKIQNRKAAWALAGIMTLDLVIFAQIPTAGWFDSTYLDEPPPLAQELMRQPQPSRVYHSQLVEIAWQEMKLRNLGDYLFIKKWIPASSIVAWKIREANSYQVLRLTLAQNYLERIRNEGPKSPLLSWAGVSTVITMRGKKRQATEDSLVAVQLGHAKPPLYLEGGENAGRIHPISNTPGRVLAHVELTKPTTLVFSEVDYPGWQARVDGSPAPHSRFADTFLAVALPIGSHDVEWIYNPISFRLGLMVSMVTLAGLAFIKLRTRLRRSDV